MSASLRTEVEVKNTLFNTVRKIPVTLGEIFKKAFVNGFIKEIKYKRLRSTNFGRLLNLLGSSYVQRSSCYTSSIAEKNTKRITCRPSLNG